MQEESRTMEVLVEQAVAGCEAALEKVLTGVQESIHRLALKMLWHPEDAEDATQEILIRIATHLSTFEKRSKFSTWAYRVAANYLLTTRRRRAEMNGNFEAFGEDLMQGLQAPTELEPEFQVSQSILTEEVRIACTQAMLQCLDRDHRVAYVLGEVLEVQGRQAAEVLEINPATFRKRLSRARSRVQNFMTEHCGLVQDQAPCRCAKRIVSATRLGRIDPNRVLFARHDRQAEVEVLGRIKALSELERVAAVHRSESLPCPSLVGRVLDLVKGRQDES